MTLKKIDIEDLSVKREIGKTDGSSVYELRDGKILKIYDRNLLLFLKMTGIDLEKRILNAKKIKNVDEIIVPDGAVYCYDLFVGYTMNKAKGIDYNSYERSFTIQDRENLEKYILSHLKMEDIVLRANKEKIVFPDLLTCDNIFVHDDNYSFIDYDGIQIGDEEAFTISTSLGDPMQYYGTKYMRSNELFTEELDKKSLIMLFFLAAFNVNLEMIGKFNPYTGEKVSLDLIFNMIGLENYDIMNKVWKLFNEQSKNEFLGDDLYTLIDDYDLRVIGRVDNTDCYIKKLIKK